MAAGGGGAPGGSFESTVDRKFLNVTNTMESIQGLSAWCIDNKKYHSLVVKHWIKCLKKSGAAHKLNLFYLANDVIQNCKRKNAMVYRTAFADVLPEAFLQINYEGDAKVLKSVERVLSIWEERGVYSGALIAELRSSLLKEDSPPETPVEQKTPVESKADLRSKIVAEFVPQALIDQLSKYKKTLEEVDLREKQLTAMRVDICSSKALKKLKDKAGGKKFSKDFEEGSAQLQEFVKFFEKQNQVGLPLLEALKNADIFYETQYKEVKIVANAYQTFANRVTNLKRKLDSLKATLPDPDESPIPSPSADAPSPTGSESPFHGLEMANPDPDLDGSAMDDEAEPPEPSPLSTPGGSPKDTETLGGNDNREVEDMELSEEEVDGGGIIVEDQREGPAQLEVSVPVPAKTEAPPAAAATAATAAATRSVPQVTTPVTTPAASGKGVNLGKIGSILSSLSSVMKNTGLPVESPAPAVPDPAAKPTPAAPVASQDASSLVSLLSKVDMTPADLLSALSKVQGHGSLDGINSFLSSPAANVSSDSSSTGKTPPSPSFTPAPAAAAPPSSSLSSVAKAPSSSGSDAGQAAASQPPQKSNPASALVQALHRDMDLTTEPEPEKSESLESKIHSFLHHNPAFSDFDFGFPVNAGGGGEHLSPVTGTDTQDGTPVRDEGGGTPTQDEMMDKSVGLPGSASTQPPSVVETVKSAPLAFQNSGQQNPDNPQLQGRVQPGVAQNGQHYPPYPYSQQDTLEHGVTAPVSHYQAISALSGGPVPGERAPGSGSGTQTVENFQRGSWYGDTYTEGGFQHPPGFNVPMSGGAGENQTPRLYQYPPEQTQDSQELASQQGGAPSSGFFRSSLPPVPMLPPPPMGFDNPAAANNSTMIHPQQLPPPPIPPPPPPPPVVNNDSGELRRPPVNSVISGMVVHDHGHKSMFHPDKPPFDLDQHRRHPPEPPPHPGNPRYQDNHERYRGELRQHDARFFPDDPYFPRVRGRLTPPPTKPEDSYYGHDFQRHGSPACPPRGPPPPHLDIRHPGLRPPLRPPFPPPHPRGPLRAPFPRMHGGDPRLMGKHPGARGGGNAGPMFPPKRPFLPPRY